MAIVFRDLPQCRFSRDERPILKISYGATLLRGATVSGVVARIGSSPDAAANAAVGTPAVVSGTAAVLVTIEPGEWPAEGDAAYIHVATTLSDGRIVTSRIDGVLIW